MKSGRQHLINHLQGLFPDILEKLRLLTAEAQTAAVTNEKRHETSKEHTRRT